MTAPVDIRRFRPRADGYDVVLVLLVVSLVAGAIVPGRVAPLASSSVALALWLSVSRAASLERLAERAGLVAVSVIVVMAVIALSLDSSDLRGAADLATALAVAILALIIGRSLLRARIVTLVTVAGLTCLYLLIGLFFAHAYLGAYDFNTDAFSASFPSVGRFDLIYFSFVTLTTVGFGDITPAIDATRALAATQAVLGQLFLVTVVARAVGMLGQERIRR